MLMCGFICLLTVADVFDPCIVEAASSFHVLFFPIISSVKAGTDYHQLDP
jgi:hypothetical protein